MDGSHDADARAAFGSKPHQVFSRQIENGSQVLFPPPMNGCCLPTTQIGTRALGQEKEINMAQRVLITARASGIGREMARAFAANGAKVFVCNIDAAGLAALAGELPRLTTGPCDVSQREQIERMVAEAAEALGGLEVLINKAGIAGPTAPVAELDPEVWEKVLQVN
jgi:hypothetical protein